MTEIHFVELQVNMASRQRKYQRLSHWTLAMQTQRGVVVRIAVILICRCPSNIEISWGKEGNKSPNSEQAAQRRLRATKQLCMRHSSSIDTAKTVTANQGEKSFHETLPALFSVLFNEMP